MTKVIAVLPISSKSKRIPRKNFVSFIGVPLYVLVLSQIVSLKKFDQVILAVDADEKIPSAIINDPSVTVYFRHANNSSDISNSEELLSEILEFEQISQAEYLFLFQATNPFIRKQYLIEAFEKIQDKNYDSILTAVSSERFFIDEVTKPDFSREIAQNRGPYYLETGLFWGVSIDSFVKNKHRIGSKPSIVEVNSNDDFGIELEDDLQFVKPRLLEYVFEQKEIHNALSSWFPIEFEVLLNQCKTKAAMENTFTDTAIKKLVCVSDSIKNSIKNGGKVILFGNGGSAADSQHIAAEFVSRLKTDRIPLPAIALTTDTSAITAIGNDYGFECIFQRQVNALVSPADVVIGISTSGKSKNVILGLDAALKIGATTVLLTGKTKPESECASIVLAVDEDDTATIQELHIQIGHLLCALSERDYVQS